MKETQGKLRVELVPTSAIIALAKVFEFGAIKYKEWSWRKADDANNKYYAALMRHLLAWRRGEEIDPESNLPHLFHVLTNAAILADINHGDDYGSQEASTTDCARNNQ